MSTESIITATLLTVLAAAHSVAGETGFIRPLISADWTIAEVPRLAANRLLRGAWHLTSVAWLSMAVVAIGGTPLTAIAVASLVSSAVIFVAVNGHPAWPLFLLAGVAGLHAEDLLSTAVLNTAGSLTVVALVAAAVLHIYWAAGGTWGADASVPTTEDGSGPTFSPGPVATVAVAVLLAVFASLLTIAMLDVGPATWETPIVTWLILAGIAALTTRAIGDGRYAGFTKKFRGSTFGMRDDRYYTPLVVFLAVGATAVVLT